MILLSIYVTRELEQFACRIGNRTAWMPEEHAQLWQNNAVIRLFSQQTFVRMDCYSSYLNELNRRINENFGFFLHELMNINPSWRL